MQKVLMTYAAVATLLAGCASIPAPLNGKFTDVSQAQASSPDSVGRQVRWGGIIVGSRKLNNTDCLEVASYPIDKFSARPYWKEPTPLGFHQVFHSGIENYSPSSLGITGRFLACDLPTNSSDDEKAGSVVTLTGILEPVQIFEVADAACEPTADITSTQAKSTPNYTATLHAAADGHCVVSLPTLRTSRLYAWKEPATVTFVQ